METALVKSGFALEAYARYLTYERRAKNPDLSVMGAVYERAISEAAKRRFDGEAGAEETLRVFWTGYCDTLVCPQYTMLTPANFPSSVSPKREKTLSILS
jgi:hypothetical protein